MKVGYARVSTDDQRLDLQIRSLKAAGCSRIYRDHGISGSKMGRPGLVEAIATLKEGDTIVVWRLDRLGRSLAGLVKTVEELGKKGIQFQSITESFDTRSSSGMLIFHIMAALAEFERNLISERTKAGMISARERGARLGRPPALNEAEIAEVIRLVQKTGTDPRDIAEKYGVSNRTIHRILEHHDTDLKH
jgi:DNA invertase Pin-like site-specific DNA recombinase